MNKLSWRISIAVVLVVLGAVAWMMGSAMPGSPGSDVSGSAAALGKLAIVTGVGLFGVVLGRRHPAEEAGNPVGPVADPAPEQLSL